MRNLLYILLAGGIVGGSFWGTLEAIDRGFFGSRLISDTLYDYRSNRSQKQWLGAGWAWPEALGVWTDGESSEITISLDTRTRNIELMIETLAYITPKRPSQQIVVKVNDREIDNWTYSLAERKASRILMFGPADIRSHSIHLTLNARDPISPLALGVSTIDSRRVALGLISLRVREFN